MPTVWLKWVAKGQEITGVTVSYAYGTSGTQTPAAELFRPTRAAALSAYNSSLTTADGLFEWTRTVTHYSDTDGTTESMTVVRNGSVVTGNEDTYYVTRSQLSYQQVSQLADSAWKGSLGAWTIQGGDYIWVRHKTTYSDGKVTYSYTPSREPNAVSSVQEYYALGTSATEAPLSTLSGGSVAEGWQTTQPPQIGRAHV